MSGTGQPDEERVNGRDSESHISIAKSAQSQLRNGRYLALKSIECTCSVQGVLTLRGSLPTYYLKQLAQASVARVDGVARVDNQIDVHTVGLLTGRR